MNELLYKIGITLIPNVGVITAKNLISYCGGVEAVFKSSAKALQKIPGVGPTIVKAILEQKVFSEAEKEIDYLLDHNIQPLFYLDKSYPRRLTNIHDAPILLYYKGNAPLNADRIVGVIGTRKPSFYGTATCEKIVNELKDYNVLIVSGLAYGIDVTAHRAALKMGIPNVGVVGHGLDTIYPFQHKQTAAEMIQNGGILTEFPSFIKPDGRHFPMRNRIIAGLSDALVVVETAKKGGSVITVNIANSYHKDVFAVPGRVGDKRSVGCNHLIKSHKACLLESVADLSYVMNWDHCEKKQSVQGLLFPELGEQEKLILSLFEDRNDLDIDYISYSTKLKNSEIASLVLGLEFKGVLKSLPGKRYAKI